MVHLDKMFVELGLTPVIYKTFKRSSWEALSDDEEVVMKWAQEPFDFIWYHTLVRRTALENVCE